MELVYALLLATGAAACFVVAYVVCKNATPLEDKYLSKGDQP